VQFSVAVVIRYPFSWYGKWYGESIFYVHCFSSFLEDSSVFEPYIFSFFWLFSVSTACLWMKQSWLWVTEIDVLMAVVSRSSLYHFLCTTVETPPKKCQYGCTTFCCCGRPSGSWIFNHWVVSRTTWTTCSTEGDESTLVWWCERRWPSKDQEAVAYVSRVGSCSLQRAGAQVSQSPASCQVKAKSSGCSWSDISPYHLWWPSDFRWFSLEE